ncbi:MAG TPA: selenide, water dikinase SelD [Acidimicrobiales bacterium]|nr:selenide, water dikinase SelD [Acidimicrobiales bacterium]
MTVTVPPAATPGNIKLTEWTSCGGCAAKWGAAPLAGLVKQLVGDGIDPALVVGLAPSDDAAVYKLSDDLALVSTTDFFPPLVDDPDDFGAIAAANACSDVFAMGGRVVLALNISAFPERMPLEAISAILGSAARVVADAGGMVAGGHTIRSEEPIFGLAVQGLVDPARVWTKAGAQPGDVLLLSKPLGTGILLAGGSEEDKAIAILSMRRLNRAAAEALSKLAEPPHAVTDVTGFGLLGHGWEVAERSGVGLEFDAAALPLYAGALAAAEAGVRTGGDPRNRSHLQEKVTSGAPEAIEALAYDPQTSGGLLAAVPAAVASGAGLVEAGFVPIGRVSEGPASVQLV